MCAKEIQKERNKQYEERHVLAVGRLRGIVSEETVPEQYLSYFQDVAIFLLELENVRRKVESGEWNRYSVDEMRSINEILYSDILGDRYEKSFGNPAFAVEQFGPEMGRMLSLLYAEMRSGILSKTEWMSGGFCQNGSLRDTTVVKMHTKKLIRNCGRRV